MMQEKIESNKRKVAELQDETMKQKLDYGREQALNKQQVSYHGVHVCKTNLQIEFQSKKIEELQKQLDET